MPEKFTVNDLVTRFINCSICAGYAQDTGRSHISDEVISDLNVLSDALIRKGAHGIRALTGLLNERADPWVRFHAAAALLKVASTEAIETLEHLKKCDGMVSLSATVVLGSHRKH